MSTSIRIASRVLCGALVLFSLMACEDAPEEPLDPLIVVSPSPSPDSVPETTTSLTGRVSDFLTAEAVPGAYVSTVPRTTILQTTARGEYIFADAIEAGQLYEVRAEAADYAPGTVPVLVRPGRNAQLDISLLPSELAAPVRIEPPVAVFTGDRHKLQLTFTNDSSGDLDLSWQAPPWVRLATSTVGMTPRERRTVTLGLEAGPLAEAIAGLEAGDSLEAVIELEDQFQRKALLHVVVVPARAEEVRFSLISPPTQEVRAGQRTRLAASVAYLALPLVGARVEATSGEGVTFEQPAVGADDDGHVVFDLVVDKPGEHQVALSLPAWPDVTPLHATLIAIEPDPCAVDPSGRNVCGEARFWQCEDGPDGPTCTDIDECALDAAGRSACGDSRFWACTNVDGAEPVCADIEECETDNGGCGDPAAWTCEEVVGGPPRCVDVDECLTNNGGCGDAARWTCANREGSPPLCEDVDECETDAAGQNGCGESRFWRCTNLEGGPPACDDVMECATNNGGCGNPRTTRCIEQLGAAPLCEDIDECEVDADGNNGCGIAERWRCTNVDGADPVCADIDECAIDNGGCGAVAQASCINLVGQAQRCEDRDECIPDANGRNGCGLATRWTCTNQPFAPPICADIDECAAIDGYNACGRVEFWRCINRQGDAPICEDLDECAADVDGLNFCGEARYWSCANVSGGPPTCSDLDECATNNGGCGDPATVACTNLEGAAPVCTELDACAVDAQGMNFCGEARYWECVPRSGLDPLCFDRNECEPDAIGRNGCGLATRWTCTNVEGAEPVCVDIDECAINNGSCGDPAFTSCVNRLGREPTCIDIDDCVVDNGGCGDRRWVRCVNQLDGPHTCTDVDACIVQAGGLNGCGVARYWTCVDTNMGPPNCTDIDECVVVGDRTGCGLVREVRCINEQGAPPTCEPCDEGSINLDLSWVNGCEYSCLATGEELCDHADNDCDGLIDENTNLFSDLDHCGACDSSCRNLPGAASTVCAQGSCQVRQCQPGLRDDNGLAEDGCEATFPEDTIFVDVFANAPAPDGSADAPFHTIQDALAVATAGALIRVLPGTYEGPLQITTPDLVIEGSSADDVTLTATTADGTAIVVTADDVTLARFTISGGASGIDVAGTQATPLARVRIYDVRIANVTQRNATTSTEAVPNAFGIRVTDATDVAITACTVAGVTGGLPVTVPTPPATNGVAGGVAHGIQLQRVGGCVVTGNEISRINGSDGASFASGTQTVEHKAGMGGNAFGIRLVNVNDCSTSHNVIATVRGGNGGRAGNDWDTGGDGGSAYGILVATGSQIEVLDNLVASLQGGQGGTDNLSGGTHFVTGGGGGGHAVGAQLTGLSFAELRGLVIQDGAAGARGSFNSGNTTRQTNGGSAYGLSLASNSDLMIANVVVAGLSGGNGLVDGRHGTVYGILDNGISRSRIDFVTLYDLGLRGYANANVVNGVAVSAGQTDTLFVTHIVCDGVRDSCIRNSSSVNRVVVGYVNAVRTGSPTLNNTTLNGPAPFSFEPGFVNPTLGDFHLLPTSQLIDLGDPGADYSNEPAPNGCAPNLGAWGNTSGATPSDDPNASHCP